MDPTTAAAVTNMSFTHLFMQSTPLVKGVMLLLVLFSVWSWAVAFIKWFDFKKSKAALDRLETALEEGNLDSVINYNDARQHPIADVFKAGVTELSLIHI